MTAPSSNFDRDFKAEKGFSKKADMESMDSPFPMTFVTNLRTMLRRRLILRKKWWLFGIHDRGWRSSFLKLKICWSIITLLFVSIVCFEVWKLGEILQFYDPQHIIIIKFITASKWAKFWKIIKEDQDEAFWFWKLIDESLTFYL